MLLFYTDPAVIANTFPVTISTLSVCPVEDDRAMCDMLECFSEYLQSAVRVSLNTDISIKRNLAT